MTVRTRGAPITYERDTRRPTVSGDGRIYYFLQGSWKKHVRLRSKTTKTFKILNEKPKPRFEMWKVQIQPRGKKRISRNRPLSQFTKISFTLVSKLDEHPLVLAIEDIVRVRDNFGKNLMDYRQGGSINVEKRQIAGSNWQDYVVPPMIFQFYPGNWKTPPGSEGFEELLRTLEKKR
ncbi:MAG: hypothetical protein V3U22_01730 [Vicinamibacteria bacterium]